MGNSSSSVRLGKPTAHNPQTTAGDNRKAVKPYPEFPLTPHPTGRWCKKIHGKIWYFGKIADGWKAALQTFKEQIDDLQAGRTPEARNKDGLRLLDLCNRWIHHKRGLVTTGELSLRTFNDYQKTAERVLMVMGTARLVDGIGPADFEKLRADFGQTWGPTRIGNMVTRTKMIFGFGFESGLLDKPVRYGPTFVPPNRKTLRRVKKAAGLRMFEAAELRRILDAADPCMKAMTMLAANGGLGNHDVGTLPLSALDLESGWLDFPRPKTVVDRKIPLWPETVAAIREWLERRPEPKKAEDAELVFLTKQRRAWFRDGRMVEDEAGESKAKGFASPVSTAFKILLDRLGINGHRNFYAIRHGFETIAGDTGDQVAVDAIMGHSDPSMAARYRERIDPERLRRVVEHVRSWLFTQTVESVAE